MLTRTPGSFATLGAACVAGGAGGAGITTGAIGAGEGSTASAAGRSRTRVSRTSTRGAAGGSSLRTSTGVTTNVSTIRSSTRGGGATGVASSSLAARDMVVGCTGSRCKEGSNRAVAIGGAAGVAAA
jgi:hypothetical protein